MQAVRKIVDANLLTSIIPLPEALKNQKLEVIIFPAENQKESTKEKSKVEDIVTSLIGAIPDEDMTLSVRNIRAKAHIERR